jgi:hypothetical protein
VITGPACLVVLAHERKQHVGGQVHKAAFVELVRDSWSEVSHWFFREFWL